MTVTEKAQFLLSIHMVKRALDRVFQVAADIQKSHPRVLLEIIPGDFSESVLAGCLPDIVVSVGLDDEEDDYISSVKIRPWSPAPQMRRELERVVRQLEAEYPAPEAESSGTTRPRPQFLTNPPVTS